MTSFFNFNGIRSAKFRYAGYLISLLFLSEFIISKVFPQKTFKITYDNAVNCFKESNFTVFQLKPGCKFQLENFDSKEKFTAGINKLGYRGAEFNPDKISGRKRILIEGDSFIFGFGVKDEETLSFQLEKKLSRQAISPFSKTEVINAGYAGGFGPDGYYLHLKNKGIDLDPDLVIFSIFVYNDLSDLGDNEWIGTGPFAQPQQIKSKKVFVSQEGMLLPKTLPLIYRIPLLKNSHLALLLNKSVELLESNISHFIDRIRFTIKKPVISDGSARDSSLQGRYYSFCIYDGQCHRVVAHLFSDLMSVIKAGKSITDKLYPDRKIRFLVLLIPADFQLYEDSLKKNQESMFIPPDIIADNDPYPQKLIKKMLDQENIQYLDLLPEFKKNKNRLYYLNDGHWNSQGHEAAAEIIKQWLEIKTM